MADASRAPRAAPRLNSFISLPYEEYAACEGINQTGLTRVLKSPHYYQHCLKQPQKDTPALFEGRMIHLCVLEPELYMQKAVVADIPKTGQRREAMLAEGLKDGIELVTVDQHDMFQRVRDAVWSNTQAYRLLARGRREVSLWWDEPAYRVRCKARLDFVSESESTPVCLDLKTAMDGTNDGFARAIVSGRYDLQVYHYLRAGKSSGLYTPERFYFVVVEKTAPYYCTVYECGDSVLGDGMVWWETAMESYSYAHHKNEWAKPLEYQTIEIPKWAKLPGAAE